MHFPGFFVLPMIDWECELEMPMEWNLISWEPTRSDFGNCDGNLMAFYWLISDVYNLFVYTLSKSKKEFVIPSIFVIDYSC